MDYTMEIYTKKQSWNRGKQDEIVRSDNEKATVEKSHSKQNRKAPSLPPNHKSKQSFSNINGDDSNLLQPYSSVTTPTGESWTSSSGTEYSPSSYTTSSTSGSVIIDDSSRNLSVRSVHEPIIPDSGSFKDKDAVNGFSQHYPAAELNLTGSTKNSFDKTEGSTKQFNTSPSEINDCANISDYVENAILNSSCTNLSSSPSKPGDNLDDVGLTHLPPRLTSFESSSTLNHDGLLKANSDSVVPSEGGLKSHYVSLDYVRSAAAEDRNRRKEDNENATYSSSSSLSSSFISSVGSEDGSTIGSDVVEKLYNKITTATAHHNLKRFAEAQASSGSAGEVKKDSLPILPPGCRRGENRKNDNLTSSVNHVDYIRPPHNETTPTAKVDDFLQRNFNNNNRLGSDNKQTSGGNAQGSSEDESTHSPGLLATNLVGNNTIEKCKHCFGVIVNAEHPDSDEMKKAKKIFGQCLCTVGEVSDAVTEIDFCNSNLKEVPQEIGDHAETLTKLLLESNTIKQLPKEMFVCQNLRYLSVSDNDITVLPPNLASLINLTHLDVSKNVIEDVPDCIRCCKSLQVLDASVNPIEKLSEGFTQLMSLRELYMNDCFFDFLPANFGRMSQLCVLELRDNQLQILPKSIRRLTQLARLDLGGNVFQEWPDVISKLTNLSELWLDCNELAKVPSDIGDLTKLTYLDLSRNFLEAIPSQIGSLEHLTDLLLSENALTILPDSIGLLRQLTMVNLELNQIAKLPDSIGKLHALEELDVSHNKLEALPPSIGNLRNLNTLLLDENKLESIPKELGLCSEMNILQLSRNQIKILPDSIGDLTNLKVLNICQNRIPYLPITMVKLNGLVALWVSPNQSKPNVPLHGKVHQNGRRILTNILFPQEEKDMSRARKVLGSVDIDDDDTYANDAADDDDLEAYAQRQRGKTHVVFDMEAITYSNDDYGEDFDQNSESDQSMEQPSFSRFQENQQSVVAKQAVGVSTHAGFLIPMNNGTSSGVHQHTVDVTAKSKPNSLSVLVESATTNTPLNFSNEKPTMKTAEITIVKDQGFSAPKFTEESFKSYSPEKEKNGSNETRLLEEHICDSELQEMDVRFPAEGTGLRTWSSHSNLPTVLTEQTDEWNPDEDCTKTVVNDVAPTFPATAPPIIKPKPNLSSLPNRTPSAPGITVPGTSVTYPSNNQLLESQKPIKTKVQMNATNNENDLSSGVEQFRDQNQRITDTSQAYSAAKGSEAFVKESDPLSNAKSDHKTAQRNPSFSNIPFMDGEDSWEGKNVTSQRHTKSFVKKPETPSKPIAENEFSLKGKPSKSESTTSFSVQPSGRNVVGDTNKIDERRDNENLCLSPGFVIEGKSSSVTSNESISATDRDSGVGNDVESQESIPDFHDDHNKNTVSMNTSRTLSANDKLSGLTNAAASGVLRGKDGWIGLVGTDEAIQTSRKNDTQSCNQTSSKLSSLMNVSKPPVSKSTNENSSALKSRYASNVAMDSTTVTYSHDYNVSRAQNDKSVSADNKNRRVAENIKKFEKFFDDGLFTSDSAEQKYKSLPAQYINQDKPAYLDKNAVAISERTYNVPPVLPITKPKQTEKQKPHFTSESLDNVFVSKTVRGKENSDKLLTAPTRRKDDSYELSEQHSMSKGKASSMHSENIDFVPTKRLSAHMKKSKFEEALAATKHKHFRDKLEKMMQQKNTSNTRLSRNSSSSVSSIPRITSPVPYHNPTPLDHMTADNTEEEAHIYQVPRSSKVNSIHSRLKEKLQPTGRSGQPPHLGSTTSPASAAGSSHKPPGSAHQVGKHQCVQRNSTKNFGGIQINSPPIVPNNCPEEIPKKSLEEQLGQLLLDGSSDLIRNNDKGFVPCVGVDSHRSLVHGKNQFPSTTDKDRKNLQGYSAHSYNSRKNPMPDDWKQQLLQHIERKKQEKEQPVTPYTTGRINVGETPRCDCFQSRTKSPHYLDAATAPSRPLFSDNYTKNTQPLENHRKNNRKESSHEHAIPRSLGVPKVAPKPLERRKRQSLSKSDQQESDFTRSSSTSSKQSGGRRSSGRFLRTRTPGPELAASESTRTELVARPKSAMDTPISSTSIFDPPPLRQSGRKAEKQQDMPHALIRPAAAPPSYSDHILRRATAGGNAQDYHDYVNVEYIDRARSSKHGKHVQDSTYDGLPDQGGYYPLRSSGSHESVLNSKTEKQYLPEVASATPGIRGSNSHDSVMDNVYQHSPRYQPPHAPYHSGAYRGHGPHVYEPTTHKREVASYPTHAYPEYKSPYGEIPAPAKTNRKVAKVLSHETKAHKKQDAKIYDNYYRQEPRNHHQYVYPPPTHMGYLNEYGEIRQDYPLHRAYGEREDESVASAFRPYQHNPNVNPQAHAANLHRSDYRFNPQPHYEDNALYYQQHQNLIDQHRNHHHPTRGQPHAQENTFKSRVDSSRYHNDRYNNVYEKDDSGDSDPSLSDEPPRHWCETDAGVELVTVTVRKNPTFGFHIMGGIDAGGNPYRPDDDGVFITYVAPAGAADGHVQPGDKILLVNGSDFVGITHKRAVDLLRNAGQVAVLVVERLVGRPV